jgi:hypothetical protein
MLSNASLNLCLTSKKVQSHHPRHYGRPSVTADHNPTSAQVINNISARHFPLESFHYYDTQFQVMSFEHGINTQIMRAIIDLLLTALSQYSKVLLVRIDLRVYAPTPDNTLISKYRKTLLRYLDKKYQSKAWFFWVREQTSRSDKAHYVVVKLNWPQV